MMPTAVVAPVDAFAGGRKDDSSENGVAYDD